MDINNVDFGTTEQLKRKDITIEARNTCASGKLIEMGSRNICPTLLDYLFDEGILGHGDIGHQRYNVGLNLREFYYSIYKSAPISSYDTLSHIPSTGEMTDKEANAHRKWSRIIKKLAPYAQIVRAICIEDNLIATPKQINKALDKLLQINL